MGGVVLAEVAFWIDLGKSGSLSKPTRLSPHYLIDNDRDDAQRLNYLAVFLKVAPDSIGGKIAMDVLESYGIVEGGGTRRALYGTLHFYTVDYRFRALWQNPGRVVKAGCINIVEPNYSVYEQSPLAHAIWQTYRKRWLARYWQHQGIRVFVDLNVSLNYAALNMYGVPKGWLSYATRAYADRVQVLGVEANVAKRWAGTDDILLMVYAGGQGARKW